MDILNLVSPRRFHTVDDLLAFISIYDDGRRTRVYRSLLHKHRRNIHDAVCVEGGAGLALFSIEMARLGARKVYAVEQNTLLANLAQQRIDRQPTWVRERIELVNKPLQDFRPRNHVHALVHEFYGQLLYDEDLWVLDKLKFRPDLVLPNGGELRAGIVSSSSYRDAVIGPEVVKSLDGVLVAGLFEERLTELRVPVMRWECGKGLHSLKHHFGKLRGDLLCLGLVVTHNGQRVCEAGKCPNWSYVWTYRKGNAISLSFRRAGPTMESIFRWIR
jgi:hypothetical protein